MLVLKIIGFTLLGILGLILLLALVILFVPLRYRGNFKNEGSDVKAYAVVTWFLGLVKIKIKYDEKELTKEGRVAFYKLFREKNEETPKEDKKTGLTAKTKDHQEENINPGHLIQGKSKTKPEAKKVEAKKEKKAEKKKERKKKEKKEGPSVLQRLKAVFKNRHEIMDIWEENDTLIIKALLKVKKLLIHILPQKIRGKAEFGFADPSTTGKVLGLVSALYGATGGLLDLEPDFENEVFRSDVDFKGRVRIFTVALILVLLYFNKELKNVGERLKELTENVQEED
ncbi:MAG: DUF2953 domain-containing protein [Lachnospiraceae bacterium]|nr:DUF2953 domain-containing protein [Lachnospiraceae bacterium]